MAKSNPIPVETFKFLTARPYPEVRWALIDDDVCPECLGELDTGRECDSCDYDAYEEIQDG